MKTRMDKYYDNHESVKTRVSKNEELYKKINDIDLDKYNPNNNVKVIGNNDDNVIDIDKIRNLLEKNYKKDTPKRKTLKVESYESNDEIDDEPTKEYNINSILEKAREEKEVDYNKERLKKLHNTQFDILNSLDFAKKEEDPNKAAKEDELMSLINTITLKENEKTTGLDPLDILSDLKGSDNTQVLSGIEEEVKRAETQQLIKNEADSLKNSFYTTSNIFTESDFDDFKDLKNDMKGAKVVIKVLIALIIIAFVIGIIILANSRFNIF